MKTVLMGERLYIAVHQSKKNETNNPIHEHRDRPSEDVDGLFTKTLKNNSSGDSSGSAERFSEAALKAQIIKGAAREKVVVDLVGKTANYFGKINLNTIGNFLVKLRANAANTWCVSPYALLLEVATLKGSPNTYYKDEVDFLKKSHILTSEEEERLYELAEGLFYWDQPKENIEEILHEYERTIREIKYERLNEDVDIADCVRKIEEMGGFDSLDDENKKYLNKCLNTAKFKSFNDEIDRLFIHRFSNKTEIIKSKNCKMELGNPTNLPTDW